MKTRRPTDLPSSLKNIDVKAMLRKRGVYLEQKQNQLYKELALPLARKALTKKSKVEPRRHAQFTNELINEYWEKQIHIVDVVENKFENKLQQFIKHIEKGFLAHFDQEIGNRKAYFKKDYFGDNEEDLIVQAAIDFNPLLENVAVLAGQEANKLIGIKDIYLPYNYREQIKQNVERFAKSLIDTDKDHLSTLITNGLEDGKSIPEIRGLIEADFDQYSKMQAQRITRTEVLRASNQAAIDAYQQSGIVEGKQWLTAGAVDECAQYEGEIVTLSNSFYSSDNEFKDGDPPLHPNCRCVVLPVVVDEKVYEAPSNKNLYSRIEELESQIDKRTKDFKELKDQKADDSAYIKSLEKYLGIDND